LSAEGAVTKGTVMHGNIAYDTLMPYPMPYPRTLVTTFQAKKGKTIDVRIGDQFGLQFPDGLRVFRGTNEKLRKK